ncbi:MAG: FtsX-like permease family protein [Micrococcales bacterium]|nr:FtsX-like permease family protein [Micrococcales bacterium]MCL2666789.1 FtsX-like permease family protein [Micrococcales bacterium]
MRTAISATVRLVVVNLRAARAPMLTLAGFAALAAMMVNLGLVLALVYPSSFDTQAAAAKAPDVWSLATDVFDSQAQLAALEAQPGVVAVEQEPVVWVTGTIADHDSTETSAVVFAVYGPTRTMDVPRLRDGAGPLGPGEVYLPFFFQAKSGYRVGDTFTFGREGTGVELTVRGFTDDVVFAADRLYVDGVTFASLADHFSTSTGVYTKVRLDDPSRAAAVRDALDEAFFDQQVTDPKASAWVSTYSGLKEESVLMGQLLAGVLLATAAVVGLVALVVVRFRVAASIEESMTNTGILTALGYTSGQVAGSLVAQFGSVVATGAVVGVVASHGLVPLVADLLEQESAIPWAPGPHPVPALVTLATVTAATLVVTGVAAARIRRLSPLTALRTGLAARALRRSYLPLATTPGRLSWLLGAKSTIVAKGQMATVGLVVVAVTFMSVVSVALYENVGARPERFAAVAFGEVTHVAVVADSYDAADEALARLTAHDGVRSAFFYSSLPVRVEGTYVNAVVTDDFAQTEGTMLYRGRYPVNDDEVVLAWAVADSLGKHVGDTVHVDNGGDQVELVVTGLMNFGLVALTTDGARRVDPQFRHVMVFVYVDDPQHQAAALTDEINDGWGVSGLLATNTHEAVAWAGDVYGTVTALVSLVVLAITAAVVVLVLFLVLSMAILRGRRGFGIQKAVGFTTGQLVAQVVMTYLPVVAVAAVVGGAAGHLTFPVLIDTVFTAMRIHVTSMYASALTSAVLVVAIVVLAGAVAALVATKVRKVVAHALITE